MLPLLNPIHISSTIPNQGFRGPNHSQSMDFPQWYIARLVLHVCRMVTEYNVWRMILKSCAWRLLSKRYVWLVSGRRQTQCFEKLRLAQCFEITRQAHCFKIRRQVQHSKIPPDAIFCDYASDVYHEWHSVVLVLNHSTGLLYMTIEQETF